MSERVDGRRARGDRTRHQAAVRAAEIATVSGLGSISVGRLAESTGLSKSGILTVFENREALQLAAVSEARTIFVDRVISPCWGDEPGLSRLRVVVQNWFDYVSSGVFPGGCFLVATTNEYGGRSGPVATAVRDLEASWVQFLEGELWVGRARDAVNAEEVSRLAFGLEAYMAASNTRYQLLRDTEQLELGRRCCLELLDSCASGAPAGSAAPRPGT